MMATDRIDIPLPFTVKKKDTCNDSDSDMSIDDINNLLSLSLPLLSMERSAIHDGPLLPNNEFMRLTEMVRAVYLSYLRKCLLNNYITCYKVNNGHVPDIEIKKCADQMELHAIRLALEATLYRKSMLKMIADIKSHTLKKKLYEKLLIILEAPKDKIDVAVQTDDKLADSNKKLLIILETPKYKIDVAVQTDDRLSDSHGTDNIQSLCITSNSEDMLRTTSPVVNRPNNFDGNENVTQNFENEMDVQMSYDEDIVKEIFNDSSRKREDMNNSQMMANTAAARNEDENSEMMADIATTKNEDENSQDSILQHMEDMFCESDDSSDLTTLIEKYSGVSKANVDKEISEICSSSNTIMDPSHCDVSQNNKILNTTNNASSTAKRSTSEGKVSYSRYKEMRNKGVDISKESKENEMIVMKKLKQKERISAVWLVERVHQTSKLETKMTELSMTNYRKHGMLKEKFHQLFGEFDEEMMPDSPICIEEHLSACKERIAPWIVKYLMPFYKKRKIKDRQLFKVVAKHIADILIIENTFPEQKCVSKYIINYFKNRKYINTKQDVYL